MFTSICMGCMQTEDVVLAGHMSEGVVEYPDYF